MFGIAAVVVAAAAIWTAAVAAQEEDPGAVTRASAQADGDCGIVIYDWNEPVTRDDRGFPSEKPPRENFDWTAPVNYMTGEFFYRAEVINQPVPQQMRLQLCFWQPERPDGNQYRLESCGPMAKVEGTSGQVITWNAKIEDLWQNDKPRVDWAKPRSRASVAIKNSSRLPVSNHSGWNWNGENPDAWYPLNMHFTGVVVPEGGEFCGWDYYLTPLAIEMASFDVSSRAASWQVAVISLVLLIILSTSSAVLAARRWLSEK